jgi:acetate kinase
MNVLVLNVGSSSVKVSISRDGEVSEVDTGPDPALDWTAHRWREFAQQQGDFEPEVALHRFVHSGSVFHGPTVMDAAALKKLHDLESLDPLHTKLALKVAGVVAEAFPESTAIACFDTTFHETLAPAAFTYAIPEQWRNEHGIRKYGFHGFAHDYADSRARELVSGRKVSRVLSCQLGSGASLAAIVDGASVDTTMGFTPLDGLVMGTRSGSVDPGALAWLLTNTKLTAVQLSKQLEHDSGLAALAGHGDMQAIMTGVAAGDESAGLAYDVWLHRLVGEMGRMIAVMGGVDVIVFSGGIGEHVAKARADAVESLAFLRLMLDTVANDEARSDAVVSAPDSPILVVVVTAREDLAMVHRAREAGVLG